MAKNIKNWVDTRRKQVLAGFLLLTLGALGFYKISGANLGFGRIASAGPVSGAKSGAKDDEASRIMVPSQLHTGPVATSVHVPMLMVASPTAWSDSATGKAWVRLANKVLLSSKEREQRLELLRNEGLIQSAVSRLNSNSIAPNDEVIGGLGERDRLRAVDFVREMIASPDLEIRKRGANAAASILGAELGDYRISEQGVLQSRIGDRIELVRALLGATSMSPDERAEASRTVIQSVRDIRLLKVLVWSLKDSKMTVRELKNENAS